MSLANLTILGKYYESTTVTKIKERLNYERLKPYNPTVSTY